MLQRSVAVVYAGQLHLAVFGNLHLQLAASNGGLFGQLVVHVVALGLIFGILLEAEFLFGCLEFGLSHLEHTVDVEQVALALFLFDPAHEQHALPDLLEGFGV